MDMTSNFNMTFENTEVIDSDGIPYASGDPVKRALSTNPRAASYRTKTEAYEFYRGEIFTRSHRMVLPARTYSANNVLNISIG